MSSDARRETDTMQFRVHGVSSATARRAMIKGCLIKMWMTGCRWINIGRRGDGDLAPALFTLFYKGVACVWGMVDLGNPSRASVPREWFARRVSPAERTYFFFPKRRTDGESRTRGEAVHGHACWVEKYVEFQKRH